MAVSCPLTPAFSGPADRAGDQHLKLSLFELERFTLLAVLLACPVVALENASQQDIIAFPDLFDGRDGITAPDFVDVPRLAVYPFAIFLWLFALQQQKAWQLGHRPESFSAQDLQWCR